MTESTVPQWHEPLFHNEPVVRILERGHAAGVPVVVDCDPEAVPHQDTVKGRILCLTYSKVQYEEAIGAAESFVESDYWPAHVVVDTDLGFVSIAIENVHGVRPA